ncbi:MAG: nitroreductase [Candidatus Neomarinimicrobiota bacterium]|nr:nitroreductase family protein [Candidatus Neomarinimicrobiota bacterium]RKY50890.1 MAG: nitroreductase [Candidatus Neomarinimicrobiota bacterium]RKY51986.1 MAG: nitroreductase [Candidatus Neomarinimicrobiota bacterium]
MNEVRDFVEMIKSRRTIRQFKQKKVSLDILKDCIDAARLAPSASNLQPVKYFLIVDDEKVRKVFPLLKWAAYISPRGNPEKGREPTGYIVVLVDKEIRSSGYEYDVGAGVENFILSAWAYGVASCWLLSVDRVKLREIFRIPEKYIIDSVVAFGYPDEKSVVEKVVDGSVKYWKDETGVFHVPKRALKEILIIDEFEE